MDIFSVKQYQDWVVQLVDSKGRVKKGVFIGYDGPNYDEYEEEDRLLLLVKCGIICYKAQDIATFTPIRKATEEEMR
ncbi:hypothetical protein NHP190003_13360 [Helicobacter sp. NHP19-003]|uniref:Uncharacterized protein n=1 Tax=Helicobacter gastrocanis TaxID=2849641 RepID=A0ABN6I3B8_9HELI|nr:hypothetical protein [Helicobacter sp. NHP19-003]BCZ18054.1 hypothetical protein NHP190003_13360 [Helicobacter sp. NHP19-003]